MKILFTSKGETWDSLIDGRFGRTEYFFIYDEESDSFQTYDNRDIAQFAHGAGPRTAQKMSEFDIQVVVTGNGPGGNAGSVIKQLGIEVYAGAGNMTLKDAYKAYQENKLTKM